MLASRTDECQTGSFRGGEVAAGWHQGGGSFGPWVGPAKQLATRWRTGGKIAGDTRGAKKGQKGQEKGNKKKRMLL